MSYSRNQGLSTKWLKNLIRQAKTVDSTLKKTLFLWENKQHNKPLSAAKLIKKMEQLILNGALNYGYSPDDFVNGSPGLAEIRKGISVRTYPYWKRGTPGL
jgi:biofilm PGA synthesis lipoprotein PgaB